MKTAISYRNLTELSHADLADLTESFLNRYLKRHLSRFPLQLVRLRAALKKSYRREIYRTRRRLGMPTATLACAQDSPDPTRALRLCSAALQLQFERNMSELRDEQSWRRKERRAYERVRRRGRS